MTDVLNVGIIGCGIIGAKQALLFSEIPDVKVIAVSDIANEKAKTVASLVNAKPYAGYKSMLEEERLDIISVATPDHLHKEPVIDSIDAGVRNIICEKPLATSLEDSYAMADAVKTKNVRFCVDFEQRWFPRFKSIKLAMAEGAIGDPVYATYALSDRIDVPLEMWGPPERSWAKNSSTADFLMSHCTDMVRWLSGNEPETVFAVSQRKKLGFAPDCFQAIIKYVGNFSACFESSWILNRSQPSIISSTIDFIGTEGTIYCNHAPKATGTLLGTEIFSDDVARMNRINSKLRSEGFASEFCTRAEDRDWKGDRINPAIRCSLRIFNEGHDLRRMGNNFKHLVNCIRLSQEPEPDIEAGVMQVRTVNAIKRSADTGRPIEMRDL